MSYVVYHKDTTRYLCRHPKVKTIKEHFVTEAAAKSALTREVSNRAVVREDFLIADSEEFHASIEKTFTVTKHGNGGIPPKPYEMPVNTPHSCDPRFETYWS